MKEADLQQYLAARFPKETGACEWKQFKRLKHAVTGAKGDDIASYVSGIANQEGGHLVIGVEDKTLRIGGIQDFHNYTADNLGPRLIGFCAHRRHWEDRLGSPHPEASAQDSCVRARQGVAAPKRRAC